MSIIIFCSCSRYTPSCSICRAGRAAYRAGLRAYRQGKSRNSFNPHSGYAYRWRDGWYAGRNANPNTASARAKEKATRDAEEVKLLKKERAELDRKIGALT